MAKLSCFGAEEALATSWNLKGRQGLGMNSCHSASSRKLPTTLRPAAAYRPVPGAFSKGVAEPMTRPRIFSTFSSGRSKDLLRSTRTSFGGDNVFHLEENAVEKNQLKH